MDSTKKEEAWKTKGCMEKDHRNGDEGGRL